MEAARANLRVVTEDGELVQGGVAAQIADLEDKNAGLLRTVEAQARKIGSLERAIRIDEDPLTHPKGQEIVELIERWKAGAGHPKSKTSADRVKVVKARLADGYSIEQLELAIDGICAYPYVGTGGQRFARGNPAQRHDRLGIALGGGEAVEKFANLGAEARKNGWSA